MLSHLPILYLSAVVLTRSELGIRITDSAQTWNMFLDVEE